MVLTKRVKFRKTDALGASPFTGLGSKLIAGPQTESLKVLVVEDSEADALLLIRVLQRNDYEVNWHRTDSLEDAEEALGREDWHLILCDHTLPGFDSFGVLDLLRKSGRDIPLIVVSASDDPSVATRSMRAGAADFISKERLSRLAPAVTRELREAENRAERRAALEILEERAQQLQDTNAELDALNERLRQQASIDPLTGLFNRRGLREALFREAHSAARQADGLVAILVDLDDFKRINDSLGHAVGDVVLREVSTVVRRALRISDYASRIGGDEFMLLLPNTRYLEGTRVAERIRRAIFTENIIQTGLKNPAITASLAVMSVEPDSSSVDELLTQMHQVLKRSKSSGKNRVEGETFRKTPSQESSETIFALEELGNPESYVAAFHPIFLLPEEEAVSYEMLSRTTITGFQMPDDFLALALENEMLTVVDHHCLRSCANGARSLPAGKFAMVNLFPSTLVDLPTEQILEDLDLDSGRRYCIEVSEQQIIGDPSYLLEPVKMLKEAGVKVAIDDVGFGRSCLESLILLEPDIIKIDRKWVTGLGIRNPQKQRVLKRLLHVARALGSDVIAEGIESEADRDALIAMGVRFGQGWYWGKPEIIKKPSESH